MIVDLTHNKKASEEKEDHNNIHTIDTRLSSAQDILREAIELSLEEINKHPSSEKRITKLWGTYLKDLNDFFFITAERTDNKDVYKKVFKFTIFRK